MSETIIVALIAAGGGVIGNYLISRRDYREKELKDKEREVRQDERLKTIEKKLDIHNGYAEKLEDVGQILARQDERLKSIEQKIK